MNVDFKTLRTEKLAKMFGATRALSNVSVSFEAGTVSVLSGHNGSGKSTLLNLLALLVRPTRGRIFFGDQPARFETRAFRSSIGVLSHAAMLYPDLSGQENLQLFAKLYGIDDVDRRVDELSARFDLRSYYYRPVRTYSRGQLQRVALARALLHSPRLLLLDEPSTGLDIASVEKLAEVVREERTRGTIQVLVTHDSGLADEIGDRNVRLERGRVVVEQ